MKKRISQGFEELELHNTALKQISTKLLKFDCSSPPPSIFPSSASSQYNMDSSTSNMHGIICGKYWFLGGINKEARCS